MSQELHTPEWVQRDRPIDMAWINDNLHVLWPAAQEQGRERGRGAVVVDTTIQAKPHGGHPFAYFDESQMTAFGDWEAVRMVTDYKPAFQLVIVLLKTQERLSVYQVQVPSVAVLTL